MNAPAAAVHDDFDVIPAAPRLRRQQAIENAITRFAPDAVETDEFVCALKSAFESRYDNRNVEQVTEAFAKLREALGAVEKRLGSVGPFEAPPQVHDQYTR